MPTGNSYLSIQFLDHLCPRKTAGETAAINVETRHAAQLLLYKCLKNTNSALQSTAKLTITVTVAVY